MLYRVAWEIDIDAESFEDAARKALDIQRDPESIATCFVITDDHGNRGDVDLGEEAPSEMP